MLARKNRISKMEFPSSNSRGTRFFSPLFSATVYPGTTINQFSVVVSKKVAKNAVDRNNLRRHFYSAVEQYINTTNNKAKVVFYPKKEAIKIKFSILQEETTKALRAAKIIK